MENLTKTEKAVKWVVTNFFKLRFFILLLGFGGISFIAIQVNNNPANTIKEVVEVITGGIIALTLFYHMISYEYDQMKFKHDVKISREKLTFEIATEWHREPMTKYMKDATKFFKKCSPLIQEIDAKKFHEAIESEEHEQEKTAFMAMFNYFESISLGIKQGIMDEEFIKGFFGPLFGQYYKDYFFYIEYRRRIKKDHTIWINFTNLAFRWVY